MMKENITILRFCEFYDASKAPNLLSTTAASERFIFTGTLDVGIVHRNYVQFGFVAGGMLGIEVKKKVETKHNMQATVELLLMNASSNFPATMLLTDLRDTWRYFWLEGFTIASCQLDLKQGIAYLDQIARKFPYTDRCNSRTAGLRGGDAHGTAELGMFEKIDVMKLLPESDVANMLDFEDEMSPSEVREWKSRKIVDFLIHSTAFQSMLAGTDWDSIFSEGE